MTKNSKTCADSVNDYKLFSKAHLAPYTVLFRAYSESLKLIKNYSTSAHVHNDVKLRAPTQEIYQKVQRRPKRRKTRSPDYGYLFLMDRCDRKVTTQ